jgi:transcriptional regulator with XRE-family HTH domain
MRNKDYRHEFVSAQLQTGIAAQLLTMRLAREWTQKQIAEKSDMAAARISVMENPSYDKFTLTTLKRLARAFDVGLMVRFVPFSEIVAWVSDQSPESLDAASFDEDRIAPKKHLESTPSNIARLPIQHTGLKHAKDESGPSRTRDQLALFIPDVEADAQRERLRAPKETPNNLLVSQPRWA